MCYLTDAKCNEELIHGAPDIKSPNKMCYLTYAKYNEVCNMFRA